MNNYQKTFQLIGSILPLQEYSSSDKLLTNDKQENFSIVYDNFSQAILLLTGVVPGIFYGIYAEQHLEQTSLSMFAATIFSCLMFGMVNSIIIGHPLARRYVKHKEKNNPDYVKNIELPVRNTRKKTIQKILEAQDDILNHLEVLTSQFVNANEKTKKMNDTIVASYRQFKKSLETKEYNNSIHLLYNLYYKLGKTLEDTSYQEDKSFIVGFQKKKDDLSYEQLYQFYLAHKEMEANGSRDYKSYL